MTDVATSIVIGSAIYIAAVAVVVWISLRGRGIRCCPSCGCAVATLGKLEGQRVCSRCGFVYRQGGWL